jgi:hypothetical protein
VTETKLPSPYSELVYCTRRSSLDFRKEATNPSCDNGIKGFRFLIADLRLTPAHADCFSNGKS